MRRYLAVSMAVALGGCTVMWAGGYNVEKRNNEMIEIWYDPLLASQAAIDLEAKKHCEQFGAVHEVESARHGMLVVSNKITYRCVKK